jgi:hypothetical protein
MVSELATTRLFGIVLGTMLIAALILNAFAY